MGEHDRDEQGEEDGVDSGENSSRGGSGSSDNGGSPSSGSAGVRPNAACSAEARLNAVATRPCSMTSLSAA